MRRARWALPALPLALLASALVPTTAAQAAGTVDLVTYVSANEDTVAAGADTLFYVNVQNVGDTTSSSVTVALSAVHGTVTGVDDNFSDVAFTCSTSSCTTTTGLVANQDVLRLAVTVHVGTTSPLTLSADAESPPDVEPNPDFDPNQATSDPPSTVVQPPAVSLTHKTIYDPDDPFDGTTRSGGPINPSNTFMDVVLTEDVSGDPVAGDELDVTCRKHGTSGPFVALDTIPNPTYYTNDQGRMRFQLNLDPTPYDCHLIHPGTLNGTAVDRLITLTPRHTNLTGSYRTKSLPYGKTLAVGIGMKFDNGDPVSYVNQYSSPVVLQRRPLGSTGSWTQVAAADLDQDTGKGSFAIKPKGSAEYRVHFDGINFGAAPASTASVAITVRQGVTTVLDPIVVPPGGVSVLTTSVRPGQSGDPVVLQHQTRSGWASNGSKRLTGTSTQTWRFKPHKQGQVTYRVFRSGLGTIAAGGSAPVTLTVTLKGKGKPSSHSYAAIYHGHPWSWNPCATIHYKVNVKDAPAHGLADVQESLRRIHLVNGLTFHYDGTTHLVPDPYTAQAEPLVVAWVRNSPYLQGAAGLGGANEARPRGDHMLYRSAFALLDAGLKLRPGFGHGITEGQLLMHELGHATGLGHSVGDKWQIMNPVLQDMQATVYGAGDIYALKHVGRSQGCL